MGSALDPCAAPTGVEPNQRRARRSLVAALALGVVALCVTATTTHSPGAAAAPPGNPTHDVIANLFEWNWGSVASECSNVLGPNGYGGVQVAPPEESVSLPNNNPAHPWWEVYQPVSYQLNSRLGNRSQFAAMVTACHNAGVKVYADAVINHMTGQGNTGYAGTTFPDKYDYAGLYSYNDFHHYPGDCPNADDGIDDQWNNQTDVQECELVSLADLRTESDYVRSKIAGYLNDLLSLGVDGFRVDAAKHINDADIAAIEGKLTKSAYVYQEIPPGGAVEPNMYENTGDVLEFTFGQKLQQQFNGNISNLQTFGQSWGMEPSSKSVTFVDNHDTDRNGSTLNYKNGATYTLANVFMLAWGYGTPQVFSSFTFSNNDQSPPASSNGLVTTTNCGNGTWFCTDRAPAIVGMVGWHNAVAGTSVANWWSDGNNAIAFSRGSSGFVTINNENGSISRTFHTGLPAGTYCDVIHGTYSNGSCSGPTVSVDASGNANLTVNAKDAVAVDVAAKTSGGGGSATVTFDEYATTYWGQNVYVVGSIPALGSWNTNQAIALSSASYPTWSASVTLPASTYFEYKYIKKNPDGSITWESDPNRHYTTPAGGSVTLNDSWR